MRSRRIKGRRWGKSHPTTTKRGFAKGEALSLLCTNFSKALFEEEINNFKKRRTKKGYPINFVENVLSKVKHEGRKLSLAKKNKQEHKRTIHILQCPI